MADPKGVLREEVQPLVVRMPIDLHAAVKARAEEDDLTMAQLVRRAIKAYLGSTASPFPA